MIMLIKDVNNFQIAKIQPRVLLSICLIFFANFNLAMVIKVLLVKKCVRYKISCNTFFFSTTKNDESKASFISL